jgi:hypothetical protein
MAAAYTEYTSTSTTITWVPDPVADLFSGLEQAIMKSYQDQRVLWYIEDKYTHLKINYINNKIQIHKKYQKMFIGRQFPIGG